MASEENKIESGLKIVTEEPLQSSDVKEAEQSDGNVTSKDGGKLNLFPHQGKDSSFKSKSVLKQGHLRVKEDGQKVYKKTPSQAIMSATQLGIGYSVGRLSATQERDVLMVDFYFVEKVWFPSAGTRETPSHKHTDFRFKAYAPLAFRYFRDLFGIQPSDFLLSLASESIKEISNPGASGSLFYLSSDDMFIIKTVTHKEATFLQQLLPGYYMNIHQNPRTLLPKFFGLYCYQSGTSNIRLTVMNNLLPSKYKCHQKFDLKGSTYKRKASKAEWAKKSPIWKDLDFQQQFPNGIQMDGETYDTVIKTISRDIRVLESFNIMDYSFLLGIHNIDESEREKEANRLNSPSQEKIMKSNPDREARKNEFGAAMEAIPRTVENDIIRPLGGVPARNEKGERLILFLGIIDILQSYRFTKKLEHGWKSLLTDADTVSVHKPSFYASRFLNFIKDQVFIRSPVPRTNPKRRSIRGSHYGGGERGETAHSKNESSGMEMYSKTSRSSIRSRSGQVVEDSSAAESNANASTELHVPKISKVVKIVEPEQSLKCSTDNEIEGNVVSINLQTSTKLNDTEDTNKIPESIDLPQLVIELTGINLQPNNTGASDVTEATNTIIDSDVIELTDVVDLNHIHITTDNETEVTEHKEIDAPSVNVEYIDNNGSVEVKENGGLIA